MEEAGVIFTDRDTVDRVERMKVCTCLNPLHTAMAVYGCLLGYTLIADEMKDAQIKGLIEKIGYQEGLPVVTDPGVLNPKDFIQRSIGTAADEWQPAGYSTENRFGYVSESGHSVWRND
mgnify:CR=1 FL=1